MPHSVLASKPVSPEVLQRVGMIAAEWSWIEKLLAEMLSFFCHAEAGAMYVITQSVSGATLTDWLRTLVEIKVKDATSSKIISDLLGQIDTARAERNTFVHGIWIGGDEPGFATVQTFNWTRAEVIQTILVSTADLEDVITHLQELQLMLGNLGVKLGFLTATNP